MPLVFSAPRSNAPPAQTQPASQPRPPPVRQQQQVTQRAPPAMPQSQPPAPPKQEAPSSSSSSFLSGNTLPLLVIGLVLTYFMFSRSSPPQAYAPRQPAADFVPRTGSVQRSAMKHPVVQRRARPYPEPNVVFEAPQESLRDE